MHRDVAPTDLGSDDGRMSDTTPPAPIELVDLVDPADLTQLHEHVLAPSFPPAELIDLDELVDGCASGRLRALGVRRDGQVVAGAVGSACAPGGIVLLVYLAIAPSARGGGIGGALLDGAVERWVAEFSPGFVLAEVEHPDYHPASPEHGDPVARLRFYERHGARLLAVPYFQPGIGPHGRRVPALLLAALSVDPALVSTRAAGAVERVSEVSAPPLRDFLVAYLRGSEGTLRQDAAVRALLDSVSGQSVPLLAPADLGMVPVAALAGA